MGEIVITGTGFGTKVGGGLPWLYLPHESDLNPDATYSRGDSGDLNHVGCSFTSGQAPTNSSGCLRALMNSGDNCPGWILPDCTAVYTFSHRKFGYDVLHDNNDTNHKYWRCWTNIGSGTGSNAISQIPDQGGSLSPRSTYDPIDSGTNGYYWYSRDGVNDVLEAITTNWHTFEHELQRSSAINTSDGIQVGWLNGARVCYFDTFKTYSDIYPENTFRHLFFSQISNNTEPADYFYYGPTLVEDSRCRVIVSDESTWNTAYEVDSVRDFCLPTEWADTEITVVLRQGIHSSLSGKYLYVVKSDGSALKIGSFD
jgi:hypothetical protein